MHIDAVRRFNRFYTRRIGVLREGLLGSPYTLTEARLLYELAQGEQATATALGRGLGLDLGYLSRLLQGLKRRGLVQAKRSSQDGRQALLALTAKGRKTFAALNARSRDEMAQMLKPLPEQDRGRLVDAMRAVESLLTNEASRAEITLRSHRPGDLGWVVHRHGALYAEEYGWDERFEALVAEIVAKFVRHFDAELERCWIAEMDGERVGSALVVKQSASTAKLRLLLVEPKARGRGVGKRLVDECIAFARAKGYRKLALWTQSNLAAARHIYRQCGFKLIRKEPHRSFGYDLTGEYWELKLA
ncbi:MAG TPA: helix-turn-helix domain-containing GNAT family N-acetyltransferase [Burkholderiales bacterium]|nr:helix-turn-helix domain-containing GNAT family N-acetyltransferase [Burkholderiales bacterium]